MAENAPETGLKKFKKDLDATPKNNMTIDRLNLLRKDYIESMAEASDNTKKEIEAFFKSTAETMLISWGFPIIDPINDPIFLKNILWFNESVVNQIMQDYRDNRNKWTIFSKDLSDKSVLYFATNKVRWNWFYKEWAIESNPERIKRVEAALENNNKQIATKETPKAWETFKDIKWNNEFPTKSDKELVWYNWKATQRWVSKAWIKWIYQWEFKDGKTNWKWNYYYESGDGYVWEFKNNSRNWLWTYTYANWNYETWEFKDWNLFTWEYNSKDWVLIGRFNNWKYTETTLEESKKNTESKKSGWEKHYDNVRKHRKPKKHEKKEKAVIENPKDWEYWVIAGNNVIVRNWDDSKTPYKLNKTDRIILNWETKQLKRWLYFGIKMDDWKVCYIHSAYIKIEKAQNNQTASVPENIPAAQQSDKSTQNADVDTHASTEGCILSADAIDKIEKWNTIDVAKWKATAIDDRRYTYEDEREFGRGPGVEFVKDWDNGFYKRVSTFESKFEFYKKDGKYVLNMNRTGVINNDKAYFDSMPSDSELNKKINEMIAEYENNNKRLGEKIERI